MLATLFEAAVFALIFIGLPAGLALVAIAIRRERERTKQELAERRKLQKLIDCRNNAGNRIFNQCLSYIEGRPLFRIEKWMDVKKESGKGFYRIAVGVAGESIAPWGFGVERGFPILQVSIHHSGEIHIHEGSYGDDFSFQNDDNGVLGAIGTVLTLLSKSVSGGQR